MPGYSASATPDGGSLHYQLFGADHDRWDMQLRGAAPGQSPYFFHITRENDAAAEHVTLHRGVSAFDPVAIAATYKTSADGEIISKAANSPAIEWHTIKNAIYAQTAVQGRQLRWYKTYQMKRTIPLIKRRHGYVLWMLQDITDVPAEQTKSLSDPVGTTLATLKLETQNPDVLAKGTTENKEAGNLVWIRLVDEQLQDAATMLLLTLWHRDRQTVSNEGLGPKCNVQIGGRSLGARGVSGWESMGTTNIAGGA